MLSPVAVLGRDPLPLNEWLFPTEIWFSPYRTGRWVVRARFVSAGWLRGLLEEGQGPCYIQ